MSRTPLMDQMALSWFCFCAVVSASPVMAWFPPQDQRRAEAWQQTTAMCRPLQVCRSLEERDPLIQPLCLASQGRMPALVKILIPEQGPKQLWLVRLGHTPGLWSEAERPYQNNGVAVAWRRGGRMLVMKTSGTHHWFQSWPWIAFSLTISLP